MKKNFLWRILRFSFSSYYRWAWKFNIAYSMCHILNSEVWFLTNGLVKTVRFDWKLRRERDEPYLDCLVLQRPLRISWMWPSFCPSMMLSRWCDCQLDTCEAHLPGWWLSSELVFLHGFNVIVQADLLRAAFSLNSNHKWHSDWSEGKLHHHALSNLSILNKKKGT